MPDDLPSLARGELHVWHAELDQLDGDAARLLSHAEHERANRIIHVRKRERWIRARGTLRLLLAHYLAADPQTLAIVPGAHGKPQLAQPELSPVASPLESRGTSIDASTLHFNVSHSGAIALYAFTEVGSVGIDVELPRRSFDALAIARRTFDHSTVRRLEALDEPARQRSFLEQWVRHEAALKCRGTGLTGPAASAHTGAARGDSANGSTAAQSDLWIEDLDLGAGAGAAAVAVGGRPSETRVLAVDPAVTWRGWV